MFSKKKNFFFLKWEFGTLLHLFSLLQALNHVLRNFHLCRSRENISTWVLQDRKGARSRKMEVELSDLKPVRTKETWKKWGTQKFISCPVMPVVQSIAVEELNCKGLLHHPGISAQTCATCSARPGWGTGDRKPRCPRSSQINRAETEGWHKAKHPNSLLLCPLLPELLEKQLLQMVSVCGRQEMGLSKTRNVWDFQCSGSVEILLDLCNNSQELLCRIGQKGMYCICTLQWLRTTPKI